MGGSQGLLTSHPNGQRTRRGRSVPLPSSVLPLPSVLLQSVDNPAVCPAFLLPLHFAECSSQTLVQYKYLAQCRGPMPPLPLLLLACLLGPLHFLLHLLAPHPVERGEVV
jgi:hypothetical protein